MDSTNRVALELARAGAPEGLVVVAGHQTAGRGRHGRTWDAPPGSSLLLSVLLRPGPALPPDNPLLPGLSLPPDPSSRPGPRPPDPSPRQGPALPPDRSFRADPALPPDRSFRADPALPPDRSSRHGPALPPDRSSRHGPALPPDRSSRHGPALPPERSHLAVAAVSLAARQACSSVAGFTPALKWPNDLVVGDAKLAGVLAEVAGDAVVVGLGLNVSLAGPWPAGAMSAEAAAGRPVDIDLLLDAVLAALADRYGEWPAVASEHRRACATLGRTVRVDLADESFTGTVADITDDGHLLVDVGMCIRTVTAGDVVHLRPTPKPY